MVDFKSLLGPLRPMAGQVGRRLLMLLHPYHRALLARHLRAGTFKNVWLTYDDEALTDGIGAQFQRVLGFYALSRAMGANYYHTPIKRLDYTGIPTDGRLSSEESIARFSNLVALQTDAGWPGMEAMRVIELGTSPVEMVRLVKLIEPGVPTLVRSMNPYPEIEKTPGHWQYLRPILRQIQRVEGAPRIAVHVRRGDLHFYAKDRLVPNSYYIDGARRLAALFPGQPHVVELYSESPKVGTTVAASDMAPWYNQGDTLIEADRDGFEDFDVLPNLVKFINLNVADTVEQMASADALVMSKSSLSMVAALLNPDRPIIYCPFWHKPMPGWMVADANGRLSATASPQFAT